VSQDLRPHMAPKASQKASNSNEPSEKRSASPSGSKLKRRRSPSVTSTDSLAGPEEWEDPARVFLTSNRQFDVPLSELGRRATQGEFQEGRHSMARTPPRPILPEPTQVDLSLIEGSSTSGPVVTKAQQPGVESDGAPSQVSDVSTGGQRRNRSPVFDIPDDASTPPVMSNPGSMDYLDAQAGDYPATQPFAPEDQDINTTQVSHVIESQQTQASLNSESSKAPRPSRNTRNILSMVNPEKKWRLQRGELLLQAALQNESDGQTQPSATVPGSSYVPSTGRKLFDQLAAKMVDGQQSSPRHDLERQSDPDLPLLDEDSREAVIVPDSEPPESANVSSTSAQPQLLTPPKDSLRVDSSLSRPILVSSMAVEDRRRNEKGDQTDDDDDEEDIPLLLTVRRSDMGAAPPSSKVNNPRGLKRKTMETKVPDTRGIFPRDNEIPSSAPEQDHRSSFVPPSPKRTRREGKERKDTGEGAFIHSERTDQVTPAPDEVSTEPADDLPMDIENDAPALQDSKPSSKRKRAPVTRRKAAYKSAPRMTSNTPSMLSGTRSTKKIKNHHPMATRVFALWKSDAAYFSGIVYEQAGQSDRFKIHFDDGDEDLVDVKNLRRLELRIGDRVSIVESKEKATVANVDGQPQGIVTVRLADEPSAELEVEVLGLKIQSRAIRSQWDNRIINADEIVALVPRTKRETPSSLRNSSASLNKKALSKVGIVVTLSVGLDWEKEKENITKIIRTNGGTVLDDWSDILSLVGEYSSNKKRWVITSDNIGTEMKDDIQQVFLVSDAANAKPRFLTALALGIPCLSVEWLRCLSSGVSSTVQIG
jgi:DNA repair protein Crb2 Tudor domain/BRCA1 C Terminus (BRCT) domain